MKGVDGEMTRFIDLSHDIKDKMTVHPYDSCVKLYQDRFLESDKYNNFRLEIGMHAGTHIDTPMHLTERITPINRISLEKFMGRGCILDVRDESVITYKEEYLSKVNEGDIVLLYTNHSNKYGTEEYYSNYPIVSKELVDFFIKKNIKILGIDSPSPDKYPFEIHKLLFDHDILIMENMTNLSELLTIKNFEIIALPLKINAEAALVRAVARV